MLNPLRQGMKRRAIRRILDDPELIQQMAGPLDRATNAAFKAVNEADVQAAMSGDFMAFTTMMQSNLLKEGFDAETIGASPFIAILQQILAALLPMLLQCIPTPTPKTVLEAIQ